MKMGPSEVAITAALSETVQKVFHSGERDDLTVNLVRARVESELGLDTGFLKQGTWKEKSKLLIKIESEKLIQEEDAGEGEVKSESSPTLPKAKAKPTPVKNEKKRLDVKKGTKRAPNGSKQAPRKRQKKEESPSDDEESELTPLENTPEQSEDSYESDEPKPKPKKEKKASPNRERKPKIEPKSKHYSDEEDENEKDNLSRMNTKSGATPKPKSKSESEGKTFRPLKVKNDYSENDEEKNSDHDDSKGDLKPDLDDVAKNDSDSDMSILIDEVPKPRLHSTAKSTKSNPPVGKSAKPKQAATLSPDEAELKTLQSYLVKCGVRKIWAFELKQYGDDNKAKIRHLKSMLKDVGMQGRFSETRAREIKEARELAADLEEVTEGAKRWGKGRESRSKSSGTGRKHKEVSDDDSGDDAGGKATRSSSVSDKPVRERAARVKADLAFLGDEESDSD